MGLKYISQGNSDLDKTRILIIKLIYKKTWHALTVLCILLGTHVLSNAVQYSSSVMNSLETEHFCSVLIITLPFPLCRGDGSVQDVAQAFSSSGES